MHYMLLLNSMVEELPQIHPRTSDMVVRYPLWMAKSILKQSLQALEFLHVGLAHGDVQPGNMLFSLNAGLGLTSENELRQLEDVEVKSITEPIRTGDDKSNQLQPLYLCASKPLFAHTNISRGFQIKLSDMGDCPAG